MLMTDIKFSLINSSPCLIRRYGLVKLYKTSTTKVTSVICFMMLWTAANFGLDHHHHRRRHRSHRHITADSLRAVIILKCA